MTSWYVYIIKCSDKTLYTGITIEIKRRIFEHNNDDKKGARYTKTRRPVKLVYFEKYKSRSKAFKREIEIKKMNREEKKLLIKIKKKTK